jgi:hypothetical protein
MPPSTARSRRRCGQPVPLSTGCPRPSTAGSAPSEAPTQMGRSDYEPGPDRLGRRGTRPGGPTLVASPQRVALHAHQRDGLRPVAAASTPTHACRAGEVAGTQFGISHSGHSAWIIVTGSVTENLATTATPDNRASAWCRPASARQTSRHDATHFKLTDLPVAAGSPPPQTTFPCCSRAGFGTVHSSTASACPAITPGPAAYPSGSSRSSDQLRDNRPARARNAANTHGRRTVSELPRRAGQAINHVASGRRGHCELDS